MRERTDKDPTYWYMRMRTEVSNPRPIFSTTDVNSNPTLFTTLSGQAPVTQWRSSSSVSADIQSKCGKLKQSLALATKSVDFWSAII
jgi:hypothetical protein